MSTRMSGLVRITICDNSAKEIGFTLTVLQAATLANLLRIILAEDALDNCAIGKFVAVGLKKEME